MWEAGRFVGQDSLEAMCVYRGGREPDGRRSVLSAGSFSRGNQHAFRSSIYESATASSSSSSSFASHAVPITSRIHRRMAAPRGARQACRGCAVQWLWAVLPGRTLPAGRGGVAAAQGRVRCLALERCRPALSVWHGGRPRGRDGFYASLGGASDGRPGTALDRIGCGLRCKVANGARDFTA